MVQFGKLAYGGLLLALGLHFLISTPRWIIAGGALVAAALPILVASTKKALRLPPGPKGIPILGYLPFLTKMPHQHMAELAQKYGPLVHFRLGATPAVIIASPAMMKEVLMTQDQVFAARPPALLSSKYFAYSPDEQGRRHGVAGAQLGPYFRNVRRLYTMEMMSAKRMECFKASRAEEMRIMVRTLWDESTGGRHGLNLRRTAFIPMANNVMTFMVCRKRYHGQEQVTEGREIQKLINDVVRGCTNVSLANFFPILRPLTAWSSEERGMAATGKRMDAYLNSLLETRRANPPKDEVEKTLVDVVLEFQRDDGTEIDDRTRKGVILEMILAGTETVATMVEWTMAELFRNPDIMYKVQSELDSVVGTSRFVEEEDMPNLKYLAAVFKETSRLHPASPLLFPHECSRQTQINGYDIPAHSRIFLNTWAIGRDPKVWDCPMDYNPDRFMESANLKVDYKGQSFNLLPFGAGRRICPGMLLGHSVVTLALAYLCQSFEWSLPVGMDPKTIDIEEQFGLACTMKHALRSYYIKPRLPLHLYTYN